MKDTFQDTTLQPISRRTLIKAAPAVALASSSFGGLARAQSSNTITRVRQLINPNRHKAQ